MPKRGEDGRLVLVSVGVWLVVMVMYVSLL